MIIAPGFCFIYVLPYNAVGHPHRNRLITGGWQRQSNQQWFFKVNSHKNEDWLEGGGHNFIYSMLGQNAAMLALIHYDF